MSVPIPCRHCGKLSIRLTLNEGSQTATCPRCSSATDVKVGLEGGALRVRTSKGPGRSGKQE
jgi:phage FluMu protein Com